MKKISLFYLSKVTFGGFVTYTSHLCKAFRLMGHDCEVYKVRNTTERKQRDFNDGVLSRNVSIETAEEIIADSDYAIVTATFWRGWKDWISKVIEAGAEVVIHDHTDYGKEFKDFMLSYGVHPIVIRQANYNNLRKDGLDPVFVPHPYVAVNPKRVERDLHAVSVCRLDYDKRTDIIIRANELLPKKERISIWGTHTRMYMFQKIVGKYKGWNDTRHYTGPMYPFEQQKFPKTRGFSVGLNNRAEFSCDMSAIKNDGGGTQYSFLEAMDGKAVLALNSDWFIGDDDEMNGVCVDVHNADELAYLLHDCSYGEFHKIVKGYKEVLEDHSPQIIIPKMIRTLKDIR